MSEGAKKTWMLGPYEAREVLSAWRKSIVLGDVHEAVYWSHTILTHGGKDAQRMLARQCWIVSGEVCDDALVVARAHAVYAMAGTVKETDHVFRLVGQMCRALKWFETDIGREVEDAWHAAIGDLKDPARRHEIPPWAKDRHTAAGWTQYRVTGQIDDSFSNDDRGRVKTRLLYERDGHLDSSVRVADDDPDFRDRWRQVRQWQAMDLPDVPERQEPEQQPVLFDDGEE